MGDNDVHRPSEYVLVISMDIVYNHDVESSIYTVDEESPPFRLRFLLPTRLGKLLVLLIASYRNSYCCEVPSFGAILKSDARPSLNAAQISSHLHSLIITCKKYTKTAHFIERLTN